MTRKTILLLLMFVLLVSCKGNKESAAVRQAERQQTRSERKAERVHRKMVRQHYKRQRKETRKTLRDYKKRARKMNKPKRFHPYLWFFADAELSGM